MTAMRVGSVNYLNAKPLIEGLESFVPGATLTLDLPSRLADAMARQELDIGLIPVVEFFRAETYSLVPGVAIASRGPVLSVKLFSRVPMEAIRSVSMDEGSRTSAALALVLLSNRYGLSPIVKPLPINRPADDVSTDAVLLIGDRAMNANPANFDYRWDLGEEWTAWTGLPMVYAAWAVQGGFALSKDQMVGFQKAKAHGVKHSARIAEREAKHLNVDPGYCRRYLGEIIHYNLDEAERAGMRRFHAEAAALGLAPKEYPKHG